MSDREYSEQSSAGQGNTVHRRSTSDVRTTRPHGTVHLQAAWLVLQAVTPAATLRFDSTAARDWQSLDESYRQMHGSLLDADHCRASKSTASGCKGANHSSIGGTVPTVEARSAERQRCRRRLTGPGVLPRSVETELGFEPAHMVTTRRNKSGRVDPLQHQRLLKQEAVVLRTCGHVAQQRAERCALPL